MEQQPNILLIISDDHRWCDSGAYGNADVYMPNLDRLAADGMRFDNYYTPSPICAPARMALYSGLFPVRNGGWPNHSQCYVGTRSIVHHLSDLGYRVGLHGKKHFGPESVFPFEQVDDVSVFMDRDPAQPYCLVIGTKEPHTPWGDISEELYDPKELALSPNLIDTPGTRCALAKYYSSLSRLDARIGEFIGYVDASDHAENTAVIYTSDHGAQFPGGKWTCYEPGLRVPFVIRWPHRVADGVTNATMIQHVDVLPTLVEIAGGDPLAIDTGLPGANDGGRGFDGTSFLSVLTGGSEAHRAFVYGVHTQHGTINGVPYPVRSVCDGKHKYILNLCHESEYSNAITGPANVNHDNAYWQEWLTASKDNMQALFLVDRYVHRPKEELYDLERDPWELENRIDDLAVATERDALSQRLTQWMKQQGDEGIETELRAQDRQKR
ncbi:MAG: sulfatase [Spirochaetales bacterium]|jgi:N-sulfoglucosamine sulfohydrolase|nr:sulfatase [Spirochaetales bacterium]